MSTSALLKEVPEYQEGIILKLKKGGTVTSFKQSDSLSEELEKCFAQKFEERRRQGVGKILPIVIMNFLVFYIKIKKFIFYGIVHNKNKNYRTKINLFFFDGVSKRCQRIRKGAASWRALAEIYNYKIGSEGFMTDFWVGGMQNAQAVRNRFLIAEEALRVSIEQQKSSVVRLLSIACGSAEPVIKNVADFKEKGVKVVLLLIDFDPTAIKYARDLAVKYGVEDQVTCVQKNIFECRHDLMKFKPHVVEMMGLIDYLDDKKIIGLVGIIHKALPRKGIMLTCHIHPNWEVPFMHNIIEWVMRYRTREELVDLIQKSGFNPKKIHPLTEPQEIHTIAVAQK